MEADLHTTNLLLGIMAGVAVLQVLVLIAAGIAGFRMYRRVDALVSAIEARHVAPAMARVNALLDQTKTGVLDVLDNVKGVTSTIRDETDRVDQALHNTVERVDRTVNRMRSNVRATTVRVAALVRGLRVMVERLRSGGPRNEPRAVEGFR
jgi:hypothetical protein